MKTPPTQRQLKVGELLRHALSKLFTRGEIPYLDHLSITVSEVRISPDMKNATAYIFPLGGKDAEHLVPVLKEYEGFIRTYLAKEVYMRHAPRISFKLDTSFEQAARIDDLLRQALV
jgi:ribosome-binding factor A